MRANGRRMWAGRAALAAAVVWGSAAMGQAPNANRARARGGRPSAMLRAVDATRDNVEGFRQPEDWGAGGTHVMNLRPSRVTIPHAADDGSPLDFEVLTYNGRSYGPTIHARRGTTLHIRVRNHLHGPPGQDKPDRPNGLCTTNLHTHGLHVSPTDPGDNIYRCIEPGQNYSFSYKIPADHPSGTYWYHPHKHGSVGYQVSNGLAGALIVDGSDDDDIADLEDIPEIAAARDRVFLFQQYDYMIGTDGVARIDAAAIYNPQTNIDYPHTCDEIDLHAPPNYDPAKDSKIAITLNGVVRPTIHIAPGEVQRWRFVHAGIEQEQQMVWTDAAGNELRNPALDPTAPQFLEIARDGLATGTMTVQPTIDLYPGYRRDVLVQAPPPPAGKKEVTYRIKKVAAPDALALRRGASDAVYLADVVVRGRPRGMKLPDPAALAPCRPYAPVDNGELSPPPPQLAPPITFRADDGSLSYFIKEKPFHLQVPAVLPLGTAQEWQLQASVDNGHPFHIHVNSFQVTGHLDDQGKPVAVDPCDWRDTLFIPAGHTYTIRSRFRDFPGQTVFHCHILDHEDQGMMMPLEFHDGVNPLPPQDLCHAAAPVPTPGPGAAQKLTPSSGRAPALRLPDAGGAIRDLAGFRGGNVALVFFQGASCPHCVASLRALVAEARGGPGDPASIVAVSALPIDDRAGAMAMLGVAPGDRFHLLVDADHGAFRDFGCFDGAPLHGLFLLDRDGTIRAGYRGASPFADAREVVRRLRSLGPVDGRSASR